MLACALRILRAPHTRIVAVLLIALASNREMLFLGTFIVGVAVGADGVMVEVHPTPELALSDAEQQLDFAMFADMMAAIVPIHDHVKGLHSDIRRHGTVPVAAAGGLSKH